MVVVGLFGAVRLRFPLFSQWGPLQVSRVGVIQSNNMVVAPTRVAWRGMGPPFCLSIRLKSPKIRLNPLQSD